MSACLILIRLQETTIPQCCTVMIWQRHASDSLANTDIFNAKHIFAISVFYSH